MWQAAASAAWNRTCRRDRRLPAIARDLKSWLEDEAETAKSNEDLARRFVEECRRTQTILPGVSVIERLCADALVAGERRIDSRIVTDAKSALHDTLCSFKNLGAALLEAKGDEESLDVATETSCGWLQLEDLVATAAELTGTMAADPIAHVVQGYHRFRRYALRMLRALDIHGATVALPLMQAAQVVADDRDGEPRSTSFLRRGSKWHCHPKVEVDDDDRLWEMAVLSHLRQAFRSGDIWLAHSRRYGDLKQALVPVEAAQATPRLTVPLAGLNLLTAIIIYWNTKYLGQAVAARRRAGLDCSHEILAHISPLGWAHILLTGEYR